MLIKGTDASSGSFLSCTECSEDVDIQQRLACDRCRPIFLHFAPLYLPQSYTRGSVERGFASMKLLDTTLIVGFRDLLDKGLVSLPVFRVSYDDHLVLRDIFPLYGLDFTICDDKDKSRMFIYQVVDAVMRIVYSQRLKSIDFSLCETRQISEGYLAVSQYTDMIAVAEFMARYGVQSIKGTFMRSHIKEMYEVDQDIMVFGSYGIHYRLVRVTQKTVDYIFFAPRKYRPYKDVEEEVEKRIRQERKEERILVEKEFEQIIAEVGGTDITIDTPVTEDAMSFTSLTEDSSSVTSGRGSCVYKVRMVIIPDADGNIDNVIHERRLLRDIKFLPDRPPANIALSTTAIYLVKDYMSYMYWADRFDVQLLGMCVLTKNYVDKPIPQVTGVVVTRYRSVSTRQNALENWLSSNRARVGGVEVEFDTGLCFNRLVDSVVIHNVPYDFPGFIRALNSSGANLSKRKFDLQLNTDGSYHIDYGSKYAAQEVLLLLSSLCVGSESYGV